MTSLTAVLLKSGQRLTTDRGDTVLVQAWAGEGSYSRVYRATLASDSTVCAIKLARGETPGAAALLEQQRRILAPLSHENLVRVFDWGRVSESPFLIMEWLPEETLQQRVASRGSLPLRLALPIFSAVLAALDCLHTAGVSHGDVFGRNVHLDRERAAVLVDPHPAPGSSSPQQDLLQASDLLALMLAGSAAAGGPMELDKRPGMNRSVIQLWRESRTPGSRAGKLRSEADSILRGL